VPSKDLTIQGESRPVLHIHPSAPAKNSLERYSGPVVLVGPPGFEPGTKRL